MSDAFRENQVESMAGFHVWCFTCSRKLRSKFDARRGHINHEVDFVRNADGARHMMIADDGRR